jgi:hypothetical protein
VWACHDILGRVDPGPDGLPSIVLIDGLIRRVFGKEHRFGEEIASNKDAVAAPGGH